MLGTRLKISAYERRHRSALLDLAWRSQWAHKHLDWYETDQWLDGDMGDVVLAWHGDQLVGYLGLSLPIHGWSWIRLLGIRDGRMPGLVLRELCQAAEARCPALGISNIAILMITNWLPTYLLERGFSIADDIITMSQIGIHPPAAPTVSARIRLADYRDVEGIMKIDRLAFDAPWQLAEHDIWQAIRSSASATVAALEDELIAYQLSTRQEGVGHLARLAVRPAHQRKGIASALMRKLLLDFRNWNVTELSVNTQLSNLPSQRLYERYGFFRNGNDMELWRKRVV